MSYSPKKGIFGVGILTSSTSASPSSGTVSIDEFYTSSGQYMRSNMKTTGLVISETQSELNTGIGPYLSSGPNSSDGLGSDLGMKLGSRACGGTMAGGYYNGANMQIYYENYDTDRIVDNGYILSFGVIT